MTQEQPDTASQPEPGDPAPAVSPQRSFWLTVGNGAISQMGNALFAPETVLATLTERLTHSAFHVGLLVSVGSVGWMWPQLFVGNLIEPLKRKKPVYILSATMRFVMLLAMGAVVLFWRGHPTTLFWLILLCYAGFASSGGIVVIPFLDMVARTIPRNRLAMLWAYRRLIGGLLGFAASLVAAFVLSGRSGISFPVNYAVLIIAGALLCGAAYVMFMEVDESAGDAPKKRASLWAFVKRGPVIFRQDADYRRFFALRSAWAFTRMSQQALFVPMAIQYFNAPSQETGGWFTAVILCVGGFSSYLWGRATERFGDVRVMQATALLDIVAPATATALALLHHFGSTAAFAGNHYFAIYVFMYAAATAALNGSDIAASVYNLALPTARLRPTYVAFQNTLYVPFLFAPALAGLMAQYISYPITFALSCASAVIAIRLSFKLAPRTESNGPPITFAER